VSTQKGEKSKVFEQKLRKPLSFDIKIDVFAAFKIRAKIGKSRSQST
jgi:hypothetical protein